MKRRFIYAFLLSIFILFLFAAPSIADTFGQMYTKIMTGYSTDAFYAALGASSGDVGLDLSTEEEYIYQLGYARGYDEALASSPSSAVNKAVSSAAAFANNTNSKSSSTMVWIPTKGGKKYHKKSTCSGMIDPRNVTIEEACQLGFDPCGRCY